MLVLPVLVEGVRCVVIVQDPFTFFTIVVIVDPPGVVRAIIAVGLVIHPFTIVVLAVILLVVVVGIVVVRGVVVLLVGGQSEG